MKDLLAGLCIIGFLVALVLLIITAGALECDAISEAECYKRIGISLVILVLTGIGIKTVEKDEGIYDRL